MLIVAGSVKVLKTVGDGDASREALICHVGPGEVLGERSMVTNQPSMASVIAADDSVALLLQRDDFKSMLPARMQPRLEKKRYASQVGTGGMQLSELAMCAVIGVGAFARVALVRHRPSGEVFALKKMDRQHLVRVNTNRTNYDACSFPATHRPATHQLATHHPRSPHDRRWSRTCRSRS